MSAPAVPLPPSVSRNPLFRWSVVILASVAVGLLLLEAFNVPTFQRVGLPHEVCYLREPRLIWLNVVADALIGIAYVSIALTLAVIVHRASKDIPFDWVFLAFGLFIVSCGVTHFMDVWVVWTPLYWLSGYVKVFTAAASVATAIALFPLYPKIFALIASARKAEQRRVEIEQLNQELERFNYSVAHDLRAPLRGIAGLGAALREDYADRLPPEAQDYLKRMEASAVRMNGLISDLLRYATIGRQEVDLKPVPLNEIVASTVAALETEIQNSHAEIQQDKNLPVVIGDATLLNVVVQNLLSNALKFVAKDTRPRVAIDARVVDGTAIVTLTDNGIGIPEEHRKRVFRMFERLHTEYVGTGIGLTIVQRALERMNGSVELDAAPQGTGSRFTLRLPAAR